MCIRDSGNWKYITFVKSGSVGKYYLEGVLQNSINAQGNLSYLNSNFFYVGGDVRDNTRMFNGDISILKIYSVALSESEVLEDYNSTNTTTNTIFHYDFSDTNSYSGSGSTITDLSGNGNNGTARNISNQFYFDQNENAFYIDQNAGDAGIVIQNHNYVTGSSDQIDNLTISAKVKLPSSSSTEQRIILSYDRSSVFRFAIGSDASNRNSAAGKIGFMFTNSSGTIDKYDGGYTGNLRDNQWHDVMVQFEANEAGAVSYTHLTLPTKRIV